MNWLRRKLGDPLKQLELESRARLGLAGLTSPESLLDVMVHVPKSHRILVDELGLHEGSLLAAMGLSDWPAHEPIAVPPQCVVGGVMAPSGEQAPPALREIKMTGGRMGQGLPDHAFLVDRFGPTRSQGCIGSCHSFATANAWIGSADECEELSPAFIFWATKQLDGIDQDGSLLKFNAQALDRFGVCHEQTHPYIPDRSFLRRRPLAAAFTEAKQFGQRMLNVTVASAKDIARVKSQLAVEKRSVAVGTVLFGSSMNSLRFHEYGILVMRLGPSDPVVGGHAWCACGYADNSWLVRHGIQEMPGGGALLIRNSWGIWAERNPLARRIDAGPGYALMPYAYLANYGWEALTVSLQPTGGSEQKRRQVVRRASNWWNHAVTSVAADSADRLRQVVGGLAKDKG